MPRSSAEPIVWTYAAALAVSLLYVAVFWGHVVMLLPDLAALLQVLSHDL